MPPSREREAEPPVPDSYQAVARRLTLLVLIVCVAGASINVVMNRQVGGNNRAVVAHADASLSGLATNEGRTVRVRYSFHASLRDVLDGGTLVVPKDSGVDPFLVESLGQMTVTVGDHPAQIDAATVQGLAGQGVEGSGALSREGEDLPFVIVPGDVDDTYLLVFHDSTAFVVPKTVLQP